MACLFCLHVLCAVYLRVYFHFSSLIKPLVGALASFHRSHFIMVDTQTRERSSQFIYSLTE